MSDCFQEEEFLGKMSWERTILKCHFKKKLKGLGHKHFTYPQPDFLKVLNLANTSSVSIARLLRESD